MPVYATRQDYLAAVRTANTRVADDLTLNYSSLKNQYVYDSALIGRAVKAANDANNVAAGGAPTT